jgi:hypothetical protein
VVEADALRALAKTAVDGVADGTLLETDIPAVTADLGRLALNFLDAQEG